MLSANSGERHGGPSHRCCSWASRHCRARPTPTTPSPNCARQRSGITRSSKANKAGYFDNALPCFDQGSNGMGEHLVNGALLDDDGALDATHPEALVYEVRAQGGWKLVAVEFIVLFDDAPANGPAPKLFGQPFTQHPSLPLWKLHAWVHRDNPLGMFTDYSPDVATCPSS